MTTVARQAPPPPSRPFLRALRFALSCAPLILAGAAAPAPATTPALPPLRGCATHRLIADLFPPAGFRDAVPPGGQAASVSALARAQAATRPGRTYLTPHFALHYTLAPTVNRPLWSSQPEDATLKARVDSLLATLTAHPEAQRDSLLHARLDALGAGHPRYVVQAGAYFELAWRYYDSLGMRMPDSSPSRTYKVPPSGRVAVDIADIGTVTSYNGPYYGLAFPPENGQASSLLIENDFLYNAAYNAGTGRSTGTPIRSLHEGRTYRDYSSEWEAGLKVTAVHEFYHAVQYQYTPSLAGYHAWYELSATGMEERLAPEVNDYFQYLPYALPRNHNTPLTTFGTLANYGNAIFHIYLTQKLGEDFDVTMWEHLAETNILTQAWVKTAGSQEAWDDLFGDYAAALSLAGTPGATGSPLAFSPDMAQWPVPFFDVVPPSGSAQLDLPATTFRLVRPSGAGAGLATLVGFTDSRRVDSAATCYQLTTLNSAAVNIADAAGATRSTAVFAHPGFTGNRNVLLSKPGLTATPARNPIIRNQGPMFLLAPSGGTQDSLRVVAESGRRVATVPVDTSGMFWSWDLKDAQVPDANARTVPAGLYWLRAGNRPPAPLLVLP